MSEETQGKSCKKCGQAKKTCTTCNQKTQKSAEEPKKCDKCEKLKSGMKPYIILSIIMFYFMIAGIYKTVVDLIQLFSN
jgi:hypothetical protein